MKQIAIAIAVTLVPQLAAAQYAQLPPNTNNEAPAPTNLDPGATGSQAPRLPPPAQPAPPRRDVVVVKPDGTMTVNSGAEPQQPKGYFVGGPSDQPLIEPDTGEHTGPVPELHVVRKGDTLWDICWFYFNDPWQWPKIWSYNPQITNPHWIYPGDLVRLLPRGLFAQENTQPEEAEKPVGPVATRPVDQPPPQRRLEVGIKQTAFVEKANLEKPMKIEGAVDEKTLLGVGDSVYISYPSGKPPQVGKRYSIYAPEKQIKEGAYVKVLGTVEVVSVKQDKLARGVLTDTNQEIERGANVGPLAKQYKTVPPVAPKVDAQGNIVARLTQADLIGQGELVFVDLGQSSGVEVGNRMFVVRRGDALPPKMSGQIGQDDRKFPARALGEIVIVEVGKNVSVGLVTLAVQEMGVGDIVMMQKSK